MAKTRDLFMETGDTKGTLHAKMGTIKERKSMDLTEAEGGKKRCQEYTEELCEKDLHDPDNPCKANDQLLREVSCEYFAQYPMNQEHFQSG